MTQVFVVDRSAFFDGDWPQGFMAMASSEPEAAAFLRRAFAAGRFVEREEAESNPAWKQWIPYCMLRCGSWSPGDDVGEPGVLLVQRTRAQSEVRLHESWSIGLGGHIEPCDGQAPGTADSSSAAREFFAAALQRELTEELNLPDDTTSIPEPRWLGIINDDSTSVGRVHAGLAYGMDLPMSLAAARELIGIREISKMHGTFTSLVDLANLWQDPARFESWSQFLLQAEIVGAMGGRS